MAALPTSGALSIGTLNGFFGGSGTSMSNFYRGGGRVPSSRTVNYTAREPTSGDYYGGGYHWVWANTTLQINWASVLRINTAICGTSNCAWNYTSYTISGYTYYRSSLVAYYYDNKNQINGGIYRVYRTYPSSYTEAINTGVPSSGTIRLSNFYGAVNS